MLEQRDLSVPIEPEIISFAAADRMMELSQQNNKQLNILKDKAADIEEFIKLENKLDNESRKRLEIAQAEHEKHSKTLKQIVSKEQTYAKEIAKLRNEREQLESLVDRIRQQLEVSKVEIKPQAGEKAFGLSKGGLYWPITCQISVPYGEYIHPKFGTKLFNKGLIFNVPSETAVRAIATGDVAYAGHLEGHGNLVILNHGLGYSSLYTQLSDISVTLHDRVQRGAIIGTTMPAKSVDESFHLEIRKNRDALNPLEWLERRR